MIFILKGADFSASNIGQLNFWNIKISTSGTVSATWTDPEEGSKSADTTSFQVAKNSINLTITISGLDGVTADDCSTTLGTGSLSGTTYTVTIPTVTGNVNIVAKASSVTPTNYTFTINPTPTSATVILSATGYPTVSGTGSKSITVANGTKVNWSVSASGYTTRTGNWTISGGNKTESIALTASGGDGETSGTLFLQNGALSVVKGENFYVSLDSTTSKECRMNSSSLTEGTGIWVPADATITLTGTSGLRFDYVYATKNAANSSTDKMSNLIGGVGTASNWVASNYFPYNADGSSNTISITNNYGQGYYYYFAISGPKKTEKLNPADYTITYVVVEAEAPVPGEVIDSGTLTLHQGALSVVTGEAGQISNNNTKRMTSASTSTANGILVPANKSVTLTGLAPSGKNAVRFDCVWASSAGPNPAYSGTTGGVWSPIIAIDSNYVAANYFPHNTSGANTCTVTNNQSSDCYVFFAFSGLTKNETIPTTDYTITYTVQ